MAFLYFGNWVVKDQDILTLSEAEQDFNFSWSAISDKKYVVLLYDTQTAYINYLVTSIPGMNLGEGLEVFSYQSPISRQHRYMFEIFEQPSGFTFNLYQRGLANLYALTKQLKLIFQVEFIIDPSI